MFDRNVQWELGFAGEDGSDDFGDDDFGVLPLLAAWATSPSSGALPTNVDDFKAINTYIVDLSRSVDGLKISGKISGSQYDKFFKLYDDWKSFNDYVMKSWYVSDEDLNVAQKKRNDINMTVQPEATKLTQKYSHQAKGGVDPKKYEEETKSFLQRNWLPVLGVVLVGGSAVYIGGALLAYLQLAKKSGIIRALGH